MTEKEISMYHGYKAYCRALSDEIAYLKLIKSRDVSGRIKELERMRTETAEKQQSILDYINGLSDRYLSKMIYSRYIKLEKWFRIAMELGGNMSGDTCRMAVKRFLEKEN